MASRLRKFAKGSIPYFDKTSEHIILSTPDGFDHGWEIFIAHDCMAGSPNRYSVILIDCQKGRIKNYACEVDAKLAHDILKEIVQELVEKKLGTNPRYATTNERY